MLIPGIMEHIERAGIHSGDSISVYPAQSIAPEDQAHDRGLYQKLAKALHVIGLINIQFIVSNDEVYVIEVNPRSSRTVPYISKVTGIPIVPLATKVILGRQDQAILDMSRDCSRRQIILRLRCRYSPLRRFVARISASGRR